MSSHLKIGYCTNVHAGVQIDAVLENLKQYAVPARMRAGGDSLGIGLWFCEGAAQDCLRVGVLARVRDALAEMQLEPYTLNGFPQGDFHSAVVKHRVYLPTWWQSERLDYTRNLIKILDGLLAPGQVGSISTLPIAWGNLGPDEHQLAVASNHLVQIARELYELHERTGRRIVLALEPEPGCYLTDTPSIRKFFRDYLSEPRHSAKDVELTRRYLSICHDICHAAVMFEDQEKELQACFDEGISLGKVQVSAAVDVDWRAMNEAHSQAAFEQLQQFAEDRYLHQTMVVDANGQKSLFEDLPVALSTANSSSLTNQHWRIHFHVPIYLREFGQLQSTQNEIDVFLNWLQKNTPAVNAFTGHLEVETYAWGVLPESLRVAHLSDGIGDEVNWLRTQLRS